MELIATSEFHLQNKDVESAVETALVACQQQGPEFEVPDLRDARIGLLLKVLAFACEGAVRIEKNKLEIVIGLLERRIFNVLQRGNNHAEYMKFPCLFPWGSGVFDGGRDRPRPMPLDQYIHCMLRREGIIEDFDGATRDAWSTWMFAQSAQVKSEVEKRMLRERSRSRFPVGTNVRVCGLKNALDLNGCRGVVVGFQEQRFQIKFAHVNTEPKAVLPANLEVAEQLEHMYITDP